MDEVKSRKRAAALTVWELAEALARFADLLRYAHVSTACLVARLSRLEQVLGRAAAARTLR